MGNWEAVFLFIGAVNIFGILIRLFVDVRDMKKEKAVLDSLGDQLVVQKTPMTHPIPTCIIPATQTRLLAPRWQDRYRGVPRTVVLTNTRTPPCRTREECLQAVRDMREKDMQQGHPDIRHNFLIGGDGSAYEGRGWAVASDKYSEIEGETIDIAFIDIIHEDQWGEALHLKMEKAIPYLLFDGITKGFLSKDFTIVNKLWLEPDRSTLPYLVVWVMSFVSVLYMFRKYDIF